MTPERWQQIRGVFEHAELLRSSERREYLDDACAGDAELRTEVESLLRAQSQAGSKFMDHPAADLMQQASVAVATASRAGRRVGAYQILDEIGHGGMGEVYRALRVDGQFDQLVAIKLVRIDLRSAFMLDRFLHERQILATLNHPNIGRLLDGGAADDGVPYLVMELIEGEPIDVYCRQRRLSITDRLSLFIKVCDAVEYAHQHLVIHRDIKPGNILVTGDGTPKLLDFGIAKILDATGGSDTTLVRPMTPEYASPEQISGEPITTAADVYSLGVVLYRLLTARSPHPQLPGQWSHAIAGTDPRRPSSAVLDEPSADVLSAPSTENTSHPVLNDREPTAAKLRRRLSGDLDSILLKALRKEPERRYGSARQFAEDIHRHLNGLPVTASKGSWSYTARKFVARHRAAVGAATLVIVALVAGIAATERQARIARTERARAQKRFDDVRAFSNSLIFDINDALQDIPGTTPARSLLLDRAAQYLDRVSADADGDTNLQRELALAYQRLATVQGDATTSNLGQVHAASISSQKATALFEAVAKANPANTVDQLNLALIYRQRAMSDLFYPPGQPEIEKALALTDRLMLTDGQNLKVQMERIIEQNVLAASLDIRGEREQSAQAYRQSLDRVLAIAQRDPAYKNIVERIAKSKVLLGFQLAHTAALKEAQAQIEGGIHDYDNLLRQGERPETVRDEAASRYRLAYVQALRGDLQAARESFRLVRDTERPLANADPQNHTFQVDNLSTDFELSRLLVLQGRYKEAEPGIVKVIAAFQGLNSEEDSGPGTGVLHAWLGEARFGQGKYDQALISFRKSLEELERDAPDDDAKCGIVTAYGRIGDTLAKLGRPGEAEAAYTSALAKSDPAIATRRADLPALLPLAAVHAGLANLKYASASAARNSANRDRMHQQACREYASANDIKNLIPAVFEFNPANYPSRPLRTPQWLQGCVPVPNP